MRQYTAKQVVREKWNACVYFAYKLKSRAQMPSLESWDGGLKMFVWHSNPPSVTDSYVKSTTYRIVLTITYLRLSGGRQSYYGSTKHSGVYRGDVIGMDPVTLGSCFTWLEPHV